MPEPRRARPRLSRRPPPADLQALVARTAVIATHLTDVDTDALGRASATVCLCPTTERDLADGIGPARALVDAAITRALELP